MVNISQVLLHEHVNVLFDFFLNRIFVWYQATGILYGVLRYCFIFFLNVLHPYSCLSICVGVMSLGDIWSVVAVPCFQGSDQ